MYRLGVSLEAKVALPNYKKERTIMKDPEIKKLWEEFIEEYKK
jgi:predicted secreted Zn-dependent protease